MTFKLKAWMIYLIDVAVIPIIVTALATGFEDPQFYTVFEFYLYTLSNTVLYGGIVLGLYYAIFKIYKRSTKKKEQGTK